MLAAANVQLRGVALVNPAARSAWRMVLVDREQPSAAARSRACRIRTGATGRSAHSASRTARSVAESSLTSTPARRASRRPPSTAARAARSSHFSQFSHLSHGVSENLSRSAPTWRGGRAHRYPPRQLPSQRPVAVAVAAAALAAMHGPRPGHLNATKRSQLPLAVAGSCGRGARLAAQPAAHERAVARPSPRSSSAMPSNASCATPMWSPGSSPSDPR
jgi:hypothetical protein